MDKEGARIEAFSDGVFAIAITLLVLEIKIPDATGGDLFKLLAKQWPSYCAFFISFAFVGIMWINHHRLFTYIRRSDDVLLLLNVLLLFGVSVVPFPTAVLAKNFSNGGQRAAAILYHGTYFVISVLFNLLWRYCVARDHHMLPKDIDVAAARRISTQYALGLILYFVCVVVAWINVPASLVMNCLLAIFFAIPPSHSLRLMSR